MTHATRPKLPARAAAVVLAAALLAGGPASGDDTLLFKIQSGKPYVYFIIDTSTSMNLKADDTWLPGSGDDAQSKFQQIKQALLQVLIETYQENGDTIHFGLATYNQDQLRVRGKHWLYRVQSASANLTDLGYPRKGSLLTFGTHFATATPGEAGSCGAPLATGTTAALDVVDRFSKLSPSDPDGDGILAYAPTTLWVAKGSQTYKLVVEHESGAFGPGVLQVRFTSQKATFSAGTCTLSGAVESVVSHLDYATEFLMSDEMVTNSAQFADCGPQQGGGGGNAENKQEQSRGIGWTWQDVEAAGTCGPGNKPFSGQGWESNYDSVPTRSGPGFDEIEDEDPLAPGSPYKVKQDTTLDSAIVLDRGDMLPLHWDLTNREALFRRLAPNWFEGVPFPELEFRAAPYFEDAPRSDGFFHLEDPDLRPLVPFGASPLNKAIVDFRCWYIGSDDQKCKASFQPFGSGWDDVAVQKDFAEWGCRRPFLIVIGDGEAHGDTNDATSAVASLKQTRVKTWAIDFGGTCASNSTYHSLAHAGNGQCLTPQSYGELVEALRKIVGEIQQATKAFASAAVPTVQADVEEKVFLSNFNPLRNEPVWMGRMTAFLKPVPLTAESTPDVTVPCTDEDDVGCFLWDAGAQLLAQTPLNPNDSPLGSGPDQRRIFYSRLTENGRWPATRMSFAAIPFTAPSGANQEERFDLYRGMGLAFAPVEVDATTNQTAQAASVEVTKEAVARKTADLAETPTNPGDDVPYVLGDVFHSNPVVTGGPSNALFFANNVNGYREFAEKHRFRRKMLVVGANDGMLHVFDAGVFRDKDDDGVADSSPLLAAGTRESFDNGTGRELFAFVPRAALRPLKDLYVGSGTNRTWTVDGTVTIADVRIDPLFTGAPDPDDASSSTGPQWRTVLIGGMREGGSGYYALDITQPDTIRDDDDRLPEVPDGTYVPNCFAGGPQCGPVPFPSQLWEFTDSVYEPAAGKVHRLNEDGDGGPDLAQTWSIPNIGRLRLIENGSPVDKYVAVFGGGLDTSNLAGNWLYMVDIETGSAIYKQKLVEPGGAGGGAAPAEPAAVDTDGDGYLDRIYLGTNRGLMYRVDLRGPAGELPELAPLTLDTAQGLPAGVGPVTVQRIPASDVRFAPRVVFKAQLDAVTPSVPERPIFYRPSVMFIARRNEYALAFGVGNRHDLWSSEGQAGRFYVMRDDIPVADKTTFYTEADLQLIDPLAAATNTDFVTDPGVTGKGWFLPLGADEKLITNPFALSGVLVFTVFDPDVLIIPGQGQQEPTCRRTGDSRIFAVNATNGNGLLYDTNLLPTRFTVIQDFVTEPYIEQGQAATAPGDATRYPPVAPHLDKVMSELRKLFPSNCKFANYRLDVKTLASDTGIIHIAPVPICIIEKNWKEF
ncbi:MAG TPA: PilC/PilY family type IV pilus protein [Thermoanaerobaculia bacterium]|nr:PilC/PilY family type IV pilus protein [Thermoanaerobaculia bacterium]